MPLTLHLTADEQKLFVKLPREVTKDTTIIKEKRAFADNENQQYARKVVARFQTPELQILQKKLASVTTEGDLIAVVEGLEFDDLPESDVRELFFVLGPDILSTMIVQMLENAKNDADIKEVADLTEIRSALLNAFVSVS